MKESERRPRTSAKPFSSNHEFLEKYIEKLEMLCRTRIADREKSDTESSEEPVRRKRHSSSAASTLSGGSGSSIDYTTLRADIQARVKATLEEGTVSLPLVNLSRQYGLSEMEEGALLAAQMYHSRKSFEHLFDKASDTGSMCVKGLLRVFCATDEERNESRCRLMPGSALVRNGLMNVGNNMRWNMLSEDDFLGIRPEVPLRISSLILGQEMPKESEREAVALVEPRTTLEELGLPDEISDEIRRIAIMEKARSADKSSGDVDDSDETRIILIYGPPGTGKHMAAQAIAGLLEKKLLRIKTDKYLRRQYDEPEDLVQTLGLARLMNAVPCFSLAACLLDEDPENALTESFADEFAAFNDTVILTANGTPDLSGNLGRHVTYMVYLPMPTQQKRKELIESLVPTDIRLAPGFDLDRVAEKIKVSGSELRKVVRSACLRASTRSGGEPELREEDFFPKARDVEEKLGSHKEASVRTTPCAKLEDVVLSECIRGQVGEIIRAVRARETVLVKWGFGEVYRTGYGISALFSGPSGTGKTLTAEAIASELGMPMRVVQLSGMMDKYVGETEKHTAEVFRNASASGEVLVFDEADALFAARVDGSENGSYYINSHINTLLKEMEDFTGVVILTTNRPFSLDPAFERRIRWKLDFPAPGWEMRAKLWRKLIPMAVPLEDGIDFERLGREYRFAGGLIRSTILKAAFAAAAEEAPLSMRHIRHAAGTERIVSKDKAGGPIGFDVTA